MKINKINSIIATLLLSTGLITSCIGSVFADVNEDFSSLKSKYMVLMDYESGKVIYKKNADQKIYPASTTKVWTAYCVLEKAKNLDEKIKIENMPEIEGSSMYLEDGEVFTTKQLLESLLVHSSNDVAYVLAKHYGGGDEKKFIDFMNQEAKKYGFTHTHFNNPHGLPDTNHYTTAMEMTSMSRIAYGNDIIKSIVAKKSVSYKKSNDVKLDRDLYNSNKFLVSTDEMEYKGKKLPFKYDIVDGIKTGFTDDAGNCLVATAKKNNTRMLSGVFFAPSGSLYHDSRFLLDYGFENFKSVTIYKKDDIKGVKNIKFAKPSSVKYSIANDYVVTTTQGKDISKDNYKVKYNFDGLDLPIKKGDIIGSMNIYENGNMVSSIGLVAETSSVNYFDYALSKIPYLNKFSSLNSSNNVDKNKKDGFFNDIKKKSSKVGDFFSNIGKNVSMAVSGIKSLFNDIKKQDGIGGLMKLDFYKFLEGEVSQITDKVPPPVIIFGLPMLVILLVIYLIVNLIVDSIRNAFSKSKKEDKTDEK